MNLNYLKNVEWSLLRGTLVWTFACVVLGLSALVFSYENKIEKEDAEEKINLQLLSLNSKTNKAINDSFIYKNYLPKVKGYIEKGYIGEQSRVLWVDILHDVTKQLKLPDMQYNISEQTAFIHKGSALPIGDFNIKKSTMQISMNLFHEGDLFTLLDSLEERSKSLYHIDQCSLRRSRMLDTSKLSEPNLSAQCDLTWISLLYPPLLTKENERPKDENTL